MLYFKKFLFVFLCLTVTPLFSAAHDYPLPPALVERVDHIADNNYNFPVIPSLRTSEDGRVAVNTLTPFQIEFYLNVPEKITQQFLESPSGVSILSNNGVPVTIPESDIDTLSVGELEFATVCDPTKQYNRTPERTNPFACGDNDEFDCYDLELFNMFKPSAAPVRMELYQTSIRVKVRSPKTAHATIESVEKLNPSILGATFNGAEAFFEPMVAGEDKRLLIGRTTHIVLPRPGGTAGQTGVYDIVYSHSSSVTPCDSTGFTDLFPISHAPYDSSINTKYGFAKNLFRDPTGKVLADGVEIGGTYPWIDKKANNFTMMGIRSKLFNVISENGVTEVKTRFDVDCITSGCVAPTSRSEVAAIEARGHVAGLFMAGLWTNGKIVYIDTPIYSSDFTLKANNESHRKVKLYSGGPNTSWVRVGAGRDISRSNLQLPGHSGNTSIFDSIENVFNYKPNFLPRSPRDVVWYISSAQRTSELVFDEIVSQKTLIYSPMNAGVEWREQPVADLTRDRWWEGMGYFKPRDGYNDKKGRFTSKPTIQNAATSQRMRIPKRGYLTGNTSKVRTEPVALGGMFGKGFFSWPNQAISYYIPSQINNSAFENRPWYMGFYIDPRFANDNQFRRFLKFPNGDAIAFKGRNSIVFTERGRGSVTISLSGLSLGFKEWSHIGLQFPSRGTSLTSKKIYIYLNGFKVGTYSIAVPSSSFKVKSGVLEFGHGLYGWLDEFKVINGVMNPEEACNHANGSLVGLSPSYTGRFLDIANSYPRSSHASIGRSSQIRNMEQLTSVFPREHEWKFACNVDYSNLLGADTRSVPAGTFSIKDELLFPEGPLVFNEPRPDSRANKFCLKCHSPTGLQGLTVSTLGPLPSSSLVQMSNDPRRQPMQPLSRIFGNLPPGHLHNIQRWILDPAFGASVDRYTNPVPQRSPSRMPASER